MKKEKRLTKKEKILRFVEERGSASFTDIQRFFVDMIYGEGTYDSTFECYKIIRNGKLVDGKLKKYRGYICGSLSSYDGYMMCGKEYLEKRGKLYYAVRNGDRKPYPKRYKHSSTPYTYDHIIDDGKKYPEEILSDVIIPKVNYEGSPAQAIVQEVLNECIEEPMVSDPIMVTESDANYNKYVQEIRENRSQYDSFRLKKSVSTEEDVPRFCRWCGHSLHPSNFETDNMAHSPNFCCWCGHSDI